MMNDLSDLPERPLAEAGVMEVRCPWSGALVGVVPNFSEAAVDEAIQRVARRTPGRDPGLDEALGRAAILMQQRAKDFAALISREQGKPLGEALEEVQLTCGLIESFSRAGYRLGEQIQPLSVEARIGERFGFTRQRPVGITALLTPNTFPLLIPAKLLMASLAAGDAAILKPAVATPLSALRLVEILREAGVNLDGVACVTGAGDTTGRAICQHPLLDQISCQGGLDTLRGVRQAMGAIPLRCHHGGSAVCLIAADADLDRAVSEIVRQRFENAGQAPISASTVLVEASVASEFVERLRVAMERITTGDPLLPETRMGPLTEPCRARQAAGIIETLVSAGAKLVHGGTCEGSAMSPALLAEADLRHPSLWTRDGYRELLSPIILSTPIEGTIEDATEWLDRRSHLVACLFTRDVERAARLASKLPVFNVHVNGIPTWRDGVIFTSDSSSRLGRRQVDVRVREVSILQDVVFHPF